jgi:CO/xanthine dehydrogenase Mo-binding subunit
VQPQSRGSDPAAFAPEWPSPDRGGSAGERAAYYGQQVRRILEDPDPDLLVIAQTFDTPSNDPAFLEPESGLAWYDASHRTLEVVLGTQSPKDSASSIADMVGATTSDLGMRDVIAHCASIGGGFGGRDHSIFPLYVALAGLFGEGMPVRLANDRFEQMPNTRWRQQSP